MQPCGPNDTRDALELIASGVVSAAQVVTHEFPLAQIAEAYRTAADANSALKTVVTFPWRNPRQRNPRGANPPRPPHPRAPGNHL